MSEFHGPDRVAELASLVRATPGLIITERQFAELARIQEEMWSMEDEMGVELDNGRISAEFFVDVSNDITKSCMVKCYDLIGKEKFDLLFGEAAYQPEMMVSREIFAKLHNAQQGSFRHGDER